MNTLSKIAVCLLAAASLCVVGLATAQSQSSATVKKAPIQPTSLTSGVEMYHAYCAVCHGKEGKGNGPAAPQLKQQPADLTTLAKRHDGKFPDEYVASVLRFGIKSPTHGTSDMPTWGPLFSAVSNRDKDQVQIRIYNLTAYIKSLQVK
ncbi:MAG TPA: c-type cytochrome [Candidatus Solibacter sp.]|nr:c-type cytochrome [Candidatus Solibacter sp.]